MFWPISRESCRRSYVKTCRRAPTLEARGRVAAVDTKLIGGTERYECTIDQPEPLFWKPLNDDFEASDQDSGDPRAR
jgi:hypothetical protein